MALNKSSVTVRFLGGSGAGQSGLLDQLAYIAARGGVGGAVPGGCVFRMKGLELRLLETHFDDFKRGEAPQADLWFLVVGLDEGPFELYEELPALGLGRVEGVFLNKCDIVDEDELIDLVRLDTRSVLEENGLLSPDTVFITGSVAFAEQVQHRAGIEALEQLLKAIVARM